MSGEVALPFSSAFEGRAIAFESIPFRHGRVVRMRAGRYDEAGWWEFDSLHNYALHAAGPLIVVMLSGAYNWPNRVEALAMICGWGAHVGIVPVFCR